MQIISKSAGLNERQVFQVTQNGTAQKVKENNGRTFDVVEYVLYKDALEGEEERELVALVTSDGDVIASNSPTVIRQFKKMLDTFTLPITNVQIQQGTSKNGRAYYNLILA